MVTIDEIKKMSVEEIGLLDFECSCGHRHRTDMRHIIIENGAINKVVGLIDQQKKPDGSLIDKKQDVILVVEDVNTRRVAGNKMKELLSAAGYEYDVCYFDDPELIAGEEQIKAIEQNLKPNTALMLAVGSGTINDITKYVSFHHNIPYYIVGTAPSMDGFASSVSPLIFNGFKSTYETCTPVAIIGDIDILKEAPMIMLSAGFGDIIGKYISICDWKMSNVINGEYYCDLVADMVIASVEKCIANVDGLYRREDEAVKAVMEALVLSGITISFVGNSRPASSSEHHLAHFWELMLLYDKKKAVLHGTKVGIGTLAACEIAKGLLSETPDFERGKQFAESWDKAKWEKEIESVYQVGAPDVLALEAEHKKNDPAEVVARLQRTIDHWDEVKEIIRKYVPDSSYVLGLMKKLDAPITPFQLNLTEKNVRDAVYYSKDMRFRYASLQTLWDLGLINKYVDIIDDYYKSLQ